MDALLNLDGAAEEARNTDEAGQISSVSSAEATKPMNFPEDVIRMIFVEFLSKPAVHLVEMTFYETTAFRYSTNLRPYRGDDAQSGYTAAQVLSKTCHLARQVLRHSTLQESHIRMDSGPVPVDAATDLVCFVLPEGWKERMRRNTMFQNLYGVQDRKAFVKKLGCMRRAGVLVTKRMWYAVLANWFTPTPQSGRWQYEEEDGRLMDSHLGGLMRCFPELEEFYFILADATVDYWKEYQHSKSCSTAVTLYLWPANTAPNATRQSELPIAFHDPGGSYAEAHERPIHPLIISDLWSSDQDVFAFPYHRMEEHNPQPNVDANQTFPRRVDAQMENRTRVALLLRLLESAMDCAGRVKFVKEVKLGVLVRKPDSVANNAAFMTPRDPRPISTERTFFGCEDEGPLGPEDSEAKWVKLALDTPLRSSQRAHTNGSGAC